MPLKVGFEVLIAHARPNLSLPPSSESDVSPHLLLQQHACLSHGVSSHLKNSTPCVTDTVLVFHHD